MTNIPVLLVVAGPSGTGKTTFMRMLQAGELDPAVEAALPGGAREWPQFGHNRRDVPTTSGPFVLHYSTTYAPRRRSGFEADSVLAPIRDADRVVVVTIHAGANRILEQLQGRQVERPKDVSFRAQLRRFRRFCRELIGKNRDLIPRYREPGWVEKTYADWDSYLAREAAKRPRDFTIIYVELMDGSAGFRLKA